MSQGECNIVQAAFCEGIRAHWMAPVMAEVETAEAAHAKAGCLKHRLGQRDLSQRGCTEAAVVGNKIPDGRRNQTLTSLAGNMRRVGTFLLLDVPRSITLGTAPGSVGCTYYESSLRELLLLLIGSIGAVEHIRCNGRGEGTDEWRADWRSFDRTAGVN